MTQYSGISFSATAARHYGAGPIFVFKICMVQILPDNSLSVCDTDTLVFPLKFRQEYLDTLYRYAKFQYECGNYSGAAEYLYFFRVLVSFSQRRPFVERGC